MKLIEEFNKLSKEYKTLYRKKVAHDWAQEFLYLYRGTTGWQYSIRMIVKPHDPKTCAKLLLMGIPLQRDLYFHNYDANQILAFLNWLYNKYHDRIEAKYQIYLDKGKLKPSSFYDNHTNIIQELLHRGYKSIFDFSESDIKEGYYYVSAEKYGFMIDKSFETEKEAYKYSFSEITKIEKYMP